MDPIFCRPVCIRAVDRSVAVTRGVVGEPLIEMAPRTPYQGRRASAARHGIETHEVMAFGDMPNDAEIKFYWAGEGFAMASGQPALIERWAHLPALPRGRRGADD